MLEIGSLPPSRERFPVNGGRLFRLYRTPGTDTDYVEFDAMS
jgi:hypothetical protein